MNNQDNSHRDASIFSNEIDLYRIFRIILDGKWIILSFVVVCSAIGVSYSLYLPNIYQSSAVLSPVSAQTGLSSSLGSGAAQLAGLAGIDLGSEPSTSNTSKAIKKLNTLSFFENNIMPNINLAELMAIKSWDKNTNKVTFNKSIYNEDTQEWIYNSSFSDSQIPTAQESFKVFQGRHFNISQDKRSGFITIRMKHQSPLIAKTWIEIIVDQINTFYRENDRSKAQDAVNYLNLQLANTSYAGIKTVISSILQKEIQKLTLIEASEYYVFEYIDPPAVMEKKSEPARAIISLFGAFLGGFLGIFILILRYFMFLRNKTS